MSANRVWAGSAVRDFDLGLVDAAMVLRFLIVLAVGAGVLYAAAYVVADLMEPPSREIVRPVPSDDFGR